MDGRIVLMSVKNNLPVSLFILEQGTMTNSHQFTRFLQQRIVGYFVHSPIISVAVAHPMP